MSDEDARFAESLKALAPAGGGDWSDVVTRSNAIGSAQRRRRLITIAVVFAAFLVATGTTLGIGSRVFDWFSASTPPGWFSVETSKSKAPATKGALAYVAGQTLYRPHKRPQRLAYPLRPMFSGDDLVVSSPNGRYIVYQAVRSERKEPRLGQISSIPMLYVHDTIARREKLLARGAMSAAWNRDGRIAYFKADRERYGDRLAGYIGHVLVQKLNGAPTVWTRHAARYEVLAWARGELIVRVDECLDLNCPLRPDAAAYALEHGGKLRPLHLETVTALSPDGRYAFGPVPVGHDDFSPLLRLVRIDTGKIVTTIDPTRSFRHAIPGLKSENTPVSLGSPSWRRSEIVCGLTWDNHTRLAIFRLRSHRLVLESIFRARVRGVPKTQYGLGFDVPLFTGPANERIVVTVSGGKNGRVFSGVLVCSRPKRSCVFTGQSFSYGAFNVVRNQSRPLAPIG